jgi:alkyl hydroperoxide reductase subunit D
MSLKFERLQESIPVYAKDLKLNLSSVFRQAELTPNHAAGNRAVYDCLLDEASKKISPETIEAAKAAAAIMGMNNIFYRFQHLVEHESTPRYPPGSA